MAGSKQPVTLNELMGKTGGDLRLSDLPDVLGEAMPDLPMDEVGRHRLLRALKNRFGEGYRNLPGVTSVIKDFDKELKIRRFILANQRRK